jgi:release factor glutamine methyltransferase
LKELLRAAYSQFEKNQIATVDAELLLAHLLGVSRKQIHSQLIELNDSDREKISAEFNDLIKQRLSGRPVQYITGSAAFRYLELEVGEGVLIPRPETELLVDRVIGYLNSAADKEQSKSIIELGAGSGAISIAIASEATLKSLKVSMVAVEKSPEAAAWLNKNIAKYDLPIRVVIEDVASALPDIKADVVVANPPYIPNDEKLPIEVAKFEPEMALLGGPVNGMQMPKLFIEAATRLLKPGGFFITEHHEKQGELIRSVLAKDYLPAQTHADLTGRDRFTSAIKRFG